MPWQLSYAAAADLENSELQTDVMRFMAILALCLVAIFAIVQSIPLAPTPDPVAEQPAASSPAAAPPLPTPPPETMAPKPPPAPAATQGLPWPEEAAAVDAVPAPVSAQATPPRPAMPSPQALPAAPRFAPARTSEPRPLPGQPADPVASGPDLATPAEEPATLSLRFASDEVLRGLVERRQVALFAIAGDRFYSLAVNAGQASFEPSAAPPRYHQMVGDTVPASLLRLFRDTFGAAADAAEWGVTLPVSTTRQLRRFVATDYRGSLVINADAALELAGRP